MRLCDRGFRDSWPGRVDSYWSRIAHFRRPTARFPSRRMYVLCTPYTYDWVEQRFDQWPLWCKETFCNATIMGS